MHRIGWGILLFVLGLSAAAQDAGTDKPSAPAEQFKALVKDFYEMTHVFSFKAKTDEERDHSVTSACVSFDR